MLIEYIHPTQEYDTLLCMIYSGKDEQLVIALREFHATCWERHGLYIYWGNRNWVDKTLFNTVVQRYKSVLHIQDWGSLAQLRRSAYRQR